MPRMVVISDTHEMHTSLTPTVMPNADILVHCGDFTNDGREPYILHFGSWLNSLPYEHLVVIAGNHDLMFERDPEVAVNLLKSRCPRVTYLNESGCEIMGLKFWGSPWSPEVPPEVTLMKWAFANRRQDLKERWTKIPYGLDVLVTHGPPHGNLGGVLPKFYDDVGDWELKAAIMEKKPRLHLCGHVHEGYGNRIYKGIRFVNAALYRSTFPSHLAKNPQIVDLDPR